METWIDFGRGPMFRLSFVLMILGLLRIFGTAFIIGIKHSIGSNGDAFEPGRLPSYAVRLGMMPNRNWNRPFVVFVETIFHISVIIVPLFVAAHVIQWHKDVGFAWWELPQPVADNLTLLVIILAPILAVVRLWRHRIRRRTEEFLKPLFVAVPFITGYICVNGQVTPTGYYTSMLIHVWAGNFLMLAIGFSNLPELAIAPATEFIGRIGQRFGRSVAPVWEAISGGEDSK